MLNPKDFNQTDIVCHLIKRPYFRIPTSKLNELNIKAFFYLETGTLPEDFPQEMVEIMENDEDKLKHYFFNLIMDIQDERNKRN